MPQCNNQACVSVCRLYDVRDDQKRLHFKQAISTSRHLWAPLMVVDIPYRMNPDWLPGEYAPIFFFVHLKASVTIYPLKPILGSASMLSIEGHIFTVDIVH